jgi:methyltransferase (TIGR00027 family)
MKECSSRTAQYTCMCRASSYLEKEELYHSSDHVSVRLLPGFIKFLLKNKLLNLKGSYSPKGIYEYVIARTKYIDHIFKTAVENGTEQILILGAGYDSRGIRFLSANPNTRVYELDTPGVQNGKAKQLAKRGIHKPENNIYIPIDFLREDIRGKLLESDYSFGNRTLFILEGLIMYLSAESVNQLFDMFRECSAGGSLVLFDYVYGSVLRKENRYYGEGDIFNTVVKADEKWTFGIEEGTISQFLKEHEFDLVEELDTSSIEERYFKNREGELVARVNGTHSIVLAGKGI